MKLNYYPDTDSLYIDLSEHPSVESREISEGVVLDYDADGRLVGIDIDNASAKVDLHRLAVSKLPGAVETVLANPARPTLELGAHGRKRDVHAELGHLPQAGAP